MQERAYNWSPQRVEYSSSQGLGVGDTDNSLVFSRLLQNIIYLKTTTTKNKHKNKQTKQNPTKVKALATAAVKEAFKTNMNLN